MLGRGFFIGGNGGGSGSGGEADSVNWYNVEGKPTSFPPASHTHDERYYRKEEIDATHYKKSEIDTNHYSKSEIDADINTLTNSLGTVKASSTDKLDYLVNKVDNVTLTVEGSELKVKSVDGLTVGITDISNWLSGTSENIQNQIDGIHSTLTSITAGMTYIGKVETYADLQSVGNLRNGNLVVVLADENRTGGRSMYVYSDGVATWDFIGEFTFTDEFISLSDTPANYTGADGKVLKVDEVNNKLIFDNVDYSELDNKPTSTITQIDDAVEKSHGHTNLNLLETYTQPNADIVKAINDSHIHPNKDILDRLDVDVNGNLTINGFARKPSYLYAFKRNSTNQPISNAESFLFEQFMGEGIPYDPATGLFTLEKDKTYKVTCSANIQTSDPVYFFLIDANTDTLPANNPSNGTYSDVGVLDVIVNPPETSNYKIRISLNSSNEDAVLRWRSSLTVVEL